jgi:hypothetical protein
MALMPFVEEAGESDGIRSSDGAFGVRVPLFDPRLVVYDVCLFDRIAKAERFSFAKNQRSWRRLPVPT